MTPAALATGCALAVAGVAQAGQLPQWSLATRPLAEIGRDDGVVLSRVLDAAVVSDGTVLVADGSTAQQPAKLWSVGPDGRVASPREPFGEGREGFGALWRLFAVGDTVLAYDIGRSAVASWLPGAEEPEFRGVPGELIVMAALSSRLWIVVQYQPDQQAERLSSSALQRRWRSIFIVSADLARRSLVGQRDIGYEYHLSEPTQYAVYRADFLGGAQFASANGSGSSRRSTTRSWRYGRRLAT